jgi:hypothetical protein
MKYLPYFLPWFQAEQVSKHRLDGLNHFCMSYDLLLYVWFFCRKIVLATNIAESSITIDDVVYVVDCGKAKETSYDALNKLACLLPSWISKASAHQVYIFIHHLG